jgi:hypothetical protein
MVTLIAVLLLVATVVFALTQMLNVSSGNVIDGQRQGDSTLAFFLAESGLDKAQAGVSGALSAGTYDNTTCTGLAGNYNLGRGSVTLSAVSTPATCSNSSCGACTVTSVAQVGLSQRTVTQDLLVAPVSGIFCNGGVASCRNTPTRTWELNLKNTSAVAGIGVFNLTYEKQGNNSATCSAGSNCRLQLDLTSPSAGVNSTGLQGNAVLIPANTAYPIYETMTKGTDSLAEVGAFFLGTSAPTLTGPTTSPGAAAYWDDNKSNTTSRTVGASGMNTGGANDGTATSTGTCSAPSAHSQACTSWCYAGDTLVFSFAGNVTLRSDQLSSVTFSTNASVGQNIPMTNVAKYPSPAVTGAPTKVDAEIWYARNPNFSGSSPLAVNASSYKGRGSGAIGAQWTSGSSESPKTAIAGTTFTVGNSFTGYPNQIISIGDSVSNSGGGGAAPTCTATCGTITAQLTPLLAGEQLGGQGRYTISSSQTVAGVNNRQWTINSNVLHVTACTICYFATGDALSGLVSGRTISSQQTVSNGYTPLIEVAGGVGRYVISGAATRVALGTNVYAGTPGTTLYLPSTSSQPSVTTPAMLIALKSGTGAMAPGTTVTAVSAPNAATTAFTVSAAPTTPLDLASVCAGTCAFFVPGTNTTFSLGGVTANFNEWAAGFMCLKGVDLTPAPVTSSTAFSHRWTELVQ